MLSIKQKYANIDKRMSKNLRMKDEKTGHIFSILAYFCFIDNFSSLLNLWHHSIQPSTFYGLFVA